MNGLLSLFANNENPLSQILGDRLGLLAGFSPPQAMAQQPEAPPLPPQRPDFSAPPMPPRRSDFSATQQPMDIRHQPQRAAAPDASSGGFSLEKLADAIGSIYGKGGPGDPLINLGVGFMSRRGIGPGLAAGLENMQRGALVKSQSDLIQQKVAKQQAELQGRISYLQQLDPKITPEAASSIASSENLFQDWVKRANPNETYTQETDAKGNIWNVNKMTGQRTVALQSPQLSPQLVEVPQADGTAQKQWMTPGQGSGVPVGAPAPQGGAGNIERDAAARERLIRASGGDPKDPRNTQFLLTGKFPREDAQPLTATDKQAILTADEAVASAKNAVDALRQAKTLSPNALGGYGASARSALGANLPDWLVPDSIAAPAASVATQELDNLVGTNALSQLKAIFGGNPTEGERAIMLELQGSSSKPDAVRQKIYDRAAEMAQRRLQFNQQRADELRGGDYYKAGGGNVPSPEPAQSAISAPAAAVEMLKSEPAKYRLHFDAKYGRGAAARILGQ